MTKSGRTEAELYLTGGTICGLLAIAGFGYGVSAFSYTPSVTLLVWGLSIAILYLGWALAVDGLVLVVRTGTSE